MTAWKWHKRGFLKGSERREDGIVAPEELLPESIEEATEVINFTEYARRKGEVYNRARTEFLSGKIANSFRSPSGYFMVMIFDKE